MSQYIILKFEEFLKHLLVARDRVAKLWRPILIDEGTTLPRWYGMSHWIPQEVRNPIINPKTLKWRKCAYPIPVNVLMAWYYMVRWYFLIGCRVDPRWTTHHTFQVHTVCPQCGNDLYCSPLERHARGN